MNILAKGIDVSSHQKSIDWEMVSKSNIDFALIRVGFRGYGASGRLVEDAFFSKNIKGALSNGIKVGLYFYSTAKNIKEVDEECHFILDALYRSGYTEKDISFPISYDFEGYGNKKYRTYGISKRQRTDNLLYFNDFFKSRGFNVLIYGSKGHIRNKFYLDETMDFLWVAQYAGAYKIVTDDEKYFPKIGKYTERIAIWQYSSIGNISGVPTRVDLNNMYINVASDSVNTNPYKEPTIKPNYKDGLIKPSEAVKWYQWELKEMGLYDGEIDGKFGKLTLNAENTLIKNIFSNKE